MADSKSVRIAGKTLDRPRHVCAFFNSADEYYSVLLPFIQEGMAQGDKAFHSVDPASRDAHVQRLKRAGIDVEGKQDSGQLEVKTWGETHLRNNRFVQDDMLDLVDDALRRGHREGYPITRLVASMEWALEDMPGVHDIVVYESRFNHLIAEWDDAVICTYDVARFGGNVVTDVLRTHPYVILRNVCQENPFYVPPERLLAELHERSA
jgi:hypothetical protein